MDHQSDAMGKQLQNPIQKPFTMSKGEGEESYSKNSGVQAVLLNDLALPHLRQALELVRLPAHGPIVVADLGCSSGPNTINIIGFIVEKLRAMLDSAPASSSQPDFQGFFNDLASNDFNTLFQMLSPDLRTVSDGATNFFAAGVPGSFYGRLFPRSFVHVFFSANSLHWLSKVPDAVLDKNSPAFNRGSLWMDKSSLEVVTAFREQASLDLKNFLLSRTAELAPGGLLVFLFNAREASLPPQSIDYILDEGVWRYLDDVWSELVSQGILTEEERDTINLPLYLRSREEVLEAIEHCGDAFQVVSAEVVSMALNLAAMWSNLTVAEMAKKMMLIIKSVLNDLFEAHIGKQAADIFWKCYERRMANHTVPLIRAQSDQGHTLRHVVVLIRK